MNSSLAISRDLYGIVLPLVKLFRNEFKSTSGRSKITLAQFRILSGIRSGANQVGKLAEQHGISQPAMSKMVDGLVKAGLLKRIPHPSDRRQIGLQLTAKASSSVQTIENRVFERIAKQISSLSDSDQKLIETGTAKIMAVLLKAGEE